MVQFAFENNKRLMMKIEIERGGKKEIEILKIKTSNKEVKKITIERQTLIFKF